MNFEKRMDAMTNSTQRNRKASKLKMWVAFMLTLSVLGSTLCGSASAGASVKEKAPSVNERSQKVVSPSDEKKTYPSPVWRLQMSEVIPGNTKGAAALWELATNELRDMEPSLEMKDWEHYAIQKMVVGDAAFYIFNWVSDVTDSDAMMGDWGHFSGKRHWFLMSKKSEKVVFKRYFKEYDEYSIPQLAGSLSDLRNYRESKDLAWKQGCRKMDVRKNMKENSDIYRECPGFVRVQSQGVEAILFETSTVEDQTARYFSFDPQTAQLASIVEIHQRSGDSDLRYDTFAKTLYLESTSMNLLPLGASVSITPRQVEAARAFEKTKLAAKYPRFRPCNLGSCDSDAGGILHRLELGMNSQFRENPYAVLGRNRLEENNRDDREWFEGADNRVQELEQKSWNLRVGWVNSYLGVFAAVNETQRILNAWRKIPPKVKQDIDPSEIALYWAAVGAEGLLNAFPSPLLKNIAQSKLN